MQQTIERCLRTGKIIAVVIAVMALPAAAAAQGEKSRPPSDAASAAPRTDASSSSDDPRYQAPIGHRQPRPSDLPGDTSRRQIGVDRSERDLDSKLRICRDC